MFQKKKRTPSYASEIVGITILQSIRNLYDFVEYFSVFGAENITKNIQFKIETDALVTAKFKMFLENVLYRDLISFG